MDLFVTGLCLQGNKGGPALALSLRQELQRALGECTFTFSVPAGEIERERAWARAYGVDVVADFTPRDVIPPFLFQGFPMRIRRVRAWVSRCRRADAVVEMSGISYVGPPAGSTRGALRNRFRYFAAAFVLRRPFLAWTQSYGPFSTTLIRRLARWDLSRQPVVFCRGADCQTAVQALLPRATAESYPDVAVVLAFDRAWGAGYISRHWPDPAGSATVTLSPSAVLYRRTTGSAEGNGHVRSMAALAEQLVSCGFRVLLVPHTTRPGSSDPSSCDLAVCHLVRSAVSVGIGVVADDLSPVELKSIIATADVHAGARYHSIVAALSSGVPCLALSWHSKYRDVMREYGMEAYVLDGTKADVAVRALDAIQRLHDVREELRGRLTERHLSAVAQVQRNTDRFAELLRRSAQ